MVFLIKTIAGFLSFTYHNYYFAGGDSAIYLMGAHDLVAFSEGSVIRYISLFLNLHRDLPEWESIYSQIIYWDSKSHFNVINDNRNAIRFNSLVSLVSFGNTYIHIIILNFITIIGLVALYKSFKSFLPQLPSLFIFIAVFLSPSILFWTSGILKETHTVFFIGVYFLLLSKFISNKKVPYILLLLLLLFLVILSRTYLSSIIIISTIFLILASLFKINTLKKNGVLLFLGGGILLIGTNLLPFSVYDIISNKQEDFIFIGRQANSFFTILPLENPWGLIKNMPIAIINVFIQPQLFNFESILYIFPIIENIDVLFFCFLAIRYFKKPTGEMLPFIIGCLLIYILSAWLIGLTVPIQGAIARYKAITQPFLLISVFSLINWDLLKENYFPVNRLS